MVLYGFWAIRARVYEFSCFSSNLVKGLACVCGVSCLSSNFVKGLACVCGVSCFSSNLERDWGNFNSSFLICMWKLTFLITIMMLEEC